MTASQMSIRHSTLLLALSEIEGLRCASHRRRVNISSHCDALSRKAHGIQFLTFLGLAPCTLGLAPLVFLYL
jgi:hypothetical protein